MQMGALQHRRRAGCTPQDCLSEEMLCLVVGVSTSMHRLLHQNPLTDGLRMCTPPSTGQSHIVNVRQAHKPHAVRTDSQVGMKLLSDGATAGNVKLGQSS